MRWIIRVAFTLVVLAVVAVVGLFFLPSDQIARIAAGQFEQATGRQLTISGKISPSFWPHIGARVEGASVANADWSDAGPMIEAEALSIGLDPQALFRGDITIRRVDVIAPVIRLERAADGRVNWDFSPKKTGATGGQNSSDTRPKSGAAGGEGFGLDRFTLDEGTVQGARLSFTDHGSGLHQTLDALDLKVALPSAGGPADVDLAAILNGVRISTVGRVASLTALLDGGAVPVSLKAGIGKSVFDFSGDAGIVPPVAKGYLAADLSDMAALAALAGAPVPDLPKGAGRGKAALEGDISWTAEQSLHLTSAVMVLDENRLSGDLTLTTSGERPKLTGDLRADKLTFFADEGEDTKTKSSGGGTKKKGAKPKGWSKEPIDVSGLEAMDAALRLDIGVLELAGTRVGPVEVALTNDRARMVFDITRMAAYGGVVAGQFVVNGRGGLSVGGDLVASGLAMQPLLTDAADYERLIGTGELAARFLGSGNSMDAIMSGLSGDGSFAFTDGALVGLDLAGMLRSLDVNYVGEGQKTIFDKITASYVIKDGVLQNDDLTLAGPLVSVAGKGKVGLGKRNLNYRVVPTALAKDDGSGGISVPLQITGPWHDPEFKLDLAALAKQKLGVDEEALKAKLEKQRKKAAKKAKKKAAKELGVDPESDESLEDAAKRKLQDEALKGLGKLFGGD
ncbi:MAG: AsmA family protein [Albidovulum sp.]|uniref:AsmA family protein n=1 Tax=Albidovulum sp. TaxID=1872424 RepID=UPI003C8EBC28